jgi:hypothetical protein
MKTIRTNPPTAAPEITAIGRDLALAELGSDMDVADG